jgi:hypothetical protein
MRVVEADWLREQLLAIGPQSASPILNIGSSTELFRTVSKPHIEQRLFAPLRAAGFDIIHVDMKSGQGVDIICRIDDPDVGEKLRVTGAKTLLCSNMLEHVENPARVAAVCESLLPSGGHLLVTVPRAYPYHPDPIDTMYRPTVDELAALFTESALVDSLAINDGSVLADEQRKGLLSLVRFPFHSLWLLFSGLWRPGIAAARWQRLCWLGRDIEVSCCHLVKQDDRSRP